MRDGKAKASEGSEIRDGKAKASGISAKGDGKAKAKVSGGSAKTDGNDSSASDLVMTKRLSDDTASTEKSCLHCGNSLLNGQKIRLHECACGKVFHHLCAGKVDHTEFSTCYDCTRQHEPLEVRVAKATNGDRRSNLKKALDTLSEAHKSLLDLSLEAELCSASESKQKKQQIGEACATVKDHAICAYQAWYQSKSAPSAQTKELKQLMGLVLELVKGTRHFSEIDFVRKKVKVKN